MVKSLSTLAVLLVLCGCGSTDRSPTVLQRYDRMRRELDWITAASSRVARDARSLEAVMSRADSPRVRTAAVRLKTDAREYARRAGAAGNSIRVLATQAPTRTVRVYLVRITDSLSRQWVEGVALEFVAEQAWFDPTSTRGNDSRRLAADVAWARRAALQASHAAATATALRRSAKAQFRYTVITPSG